VGCPYRRIIISEQSRAKEPSPFVAKLILPLRRVEATATWGNPDISFTPRASRSGKEKIRSPAIGFGKDMVEGADHYDTFEKAKEQYLLDADTDYSDLPLHVFGFTTTNGRFVNREEAYNIARVSGQVKKQKTTMKSFASEDLSAP